MSMFKTPKEKFRNSVGFQFNFVQFSGLDIESAINNICNGADQLVESETEQLKSLLNDALIALRCNPTNFPATQEAIAKARVPDFKLTAKINL